MSIIPFPTNRAKQRPLELDDLLAETYPEAIMWALPRVPDRLMEDALLPGEAPLSYEERLAECRTEFVKLLVTWMDAHGLSVTDLQDEIAHPTAPASALDIPLPPAGRDPLVWVLDPELLEPVGRNDDPAEIARQEALADILDEMALELRDEASLEVAA
jgi:hypothetical protein